MVKTFLLVLLQLLLAFVPLMVVAEAMV